MNEERSMLSQGPVFSAGTVFADVTADDLARISRTRVFFGHQSVGMNVLGGVCGVYASHGLAAPAIEADGAAPGRDRGFIDHAFIGENESPRRKIRDFDAKVRSGIGRYVDVALMKLCYVDIKSTTDVGALFTRYRETLGALERDFPRVAFVHVTVPLMTEPGQLSKLKSRLIGRARYGAADNAARERLNTLIRRAYAGDRLFDLAAVESTAPDGRRTAGTYREQRYYHLYQGYAADPGHLNDEGARIAAAAWLHAVAQASPK
jgi:hypothetical protein